MNTPLDYVVPTGDFIEEWLDDNGMTQAELARRLGCTPKHVSMLLHGSPLTQDFALRLARVTGIPSQRWMELETFYRAECDRLALEQSASEVREVLGGLPLSLLRKLGHIKSTMREPGKCAIETLAFYRVGSLDALRSQIREPVAAAAFRQSNQLDWGARLTWLRLVEQDAAERTVTSNYNHDALIRLVPQFRELITRPVPEYGAELVSGLADVGVRLIFVEAVPKAGTYGVARWFDGAPLIALSLRRKSEDQFWFTLFHELFHVMRHKLTADGFVSGEWEDGTLEDEANAFAGETLIPARYTARLRELRSIGDVQKFAEDVGVTPGIVVGRLHHDQIWDYTKGHGLVTRLRLIATADE